MLMKKGLRNAKRVLPVIFVLQVPQTLPLLLVQQVTIVHQEPSLQMSTRVMLAHTIISHYNQVKECVWIVCLECTVLEWEIPFLLAHVIQDGTVWGVLLQTDPMILLLVTSVLLAFTALRAHLSLFLVVLECTVVIMA